MLLPIREEKVLFTFLLLMACIVIPILCYATGAFPKPFVFAPAIFDCYLLTLLAFWLKRVRLSWLVWIVSILLLGGEVFSLLCYQSPYSMTVLQLLLETNKREASEFLSGHGVAGLLALSTAITFATVFVAWSLLRLLRKKKLPKALLLFLLLLSASCQGYSYYRLYQAYTADVTTTIAENKYMPLRHSPLYNPEARQTTPNLCRMKEEGNLVVYDDAVTPYNVTSKTFRHMFSTYYPGCGREWVDCTLFPAIFRKAGYRVWFITNQFAGEENNKDHHDHAGGTIFNQRDLRRLQFSHMNIEASRYDMELLSQVPPADTLSAQPSLLIFHMIGQHEDFCERYPASFNHFTADSIQNPFTDERGRRIVADYDNATLYNDAVVSELLKRYASQDAVAIYLSDHGEEIYDWRNSCYRTNSDMMTPEIARYQYEIPLLFYVTDCFKSRHPELYNEIQAAQHKPFIATMLPFALFHLAGISHADYKPSLDILSPDYDERRPRMIRDDVDYDELMGRR